MRPDHIPAKAPGEPEPDDLGPISVFAMVFPGLTQVVLQTARQGPRSPTNWRFDATGAGGSPPQRSENARRLLDSSGGSSHNSATETHSQQDFGNFLLLYVLPELAMSLSDTPTTQFAEALDAHDEIVCRCLKVRLSTIATAIDVCGAATVRDLKCSTGAGDGCMACHARLRQLLQNRANAEALNVFVP